MSLAEPFKVFRGGFVEGCNVAPSSRLTELLAHARAASEVPRDLCGRSLLSWTAGRCGFDARPRARRPRAFLPLRAEAAPFVAARLPRATRCKYTAIRPAFGQRQPRQVAGAVTAAYPFRVRLEAAFGLSAAAWCRDCGAEVADWPARLRPPDGGPRDGVCDGGGAVVFVEKFGACATCGGGRFAVRVGVALE